MALAFSTKKRFTVGELHGRVLDITLDAAYPALGWPITAQQLGLGLNGVIWYVETGIKGGFFTEWDQVNNKLMVRDASGGVGVASPEVAANLAALNGLVLRVIVYGQGSPG